MASCLNRCLSFGLACCSLSVMAAEEKPLWEIGAGVAAFSFPSSTPSSIVPEGPVESEN